ncbi:exopolysaccharide biosynthesis protein [Stenotrophomonas sp. STM01]|uniref:exopolysaccharide biosynthesis protein n=1 Tax=Stenotrophomonas sp. STM01 TaxID=2769278 RepID=UPI001783834F|nr:exopolysaccharide biosynthesis protein [Stenotrophomonas sp. STM01]MBD9537171.1 exopolysaccharide biosynthesis protein [Stenotrophomonas sp. STM01]
MTPPAEQDDPALDNAYQNEGIRTLLGMFEKGDPAEQLSLGQVLHGLEQSAFGMFLFIAILPSFIPIPGVGGAVSGPLVLLIGLQLIIGLSRPWLPGFIARRGPRRSTMHKFLNRISRPLQRLDRMLKPRLPLLIDPLPARILTGLLLILTGILLSLPIPFTNYLFGFQLLLFALALIERDGALMLFNWIAAIAGGVFFGMGSGQLVSSMLELFQRWTGG